MRSTKVALKAMLVNEASTAPTPAGAGEMAPCSASVAAAATALALAVHCAHPARSACMHWLFLLIGFAILVMSFLTTSSVLMVLCWLVAAVTAISGIKYLWDNRSFINTAK